MLNELILQLLSAVEIAVKNSPSKLDDITIIPLVKMIRNLISNSEPGDIESRREWTRKRIELRQVQNLVDNSEIEKILLSEGIWQEKIDIYIQSLLDKNNVKN